MTETLSIWVIYDHPTEYPDHFVARRFAYDQPTPDIKLASDIMALRADMLTQGLVCITRSPDDDAKIVETWL